jgi:hypothetical protein
VIQAGIPYAALPRGYARGVVMYNISPQGEEMIAFRNVYERV